MGLNDDRCYSVLLSGPMGVGKTKLSKLFAEKISNNVIKIDGSEYTEAHTISKLIGSPAGYIGYDDNKNIFDSIKNNPFSVIILDEIDKMNEKIINLFYQILDDGKITDSKGESIYFNNCIIIMTTNIGYNNNIGFNNKKNNEIREYFGNSFISRIDNIIELNKLNKNDIYDIISEDIKRLKSKYNNIKLSIGSKAKEKILELSCYEECGARKIENLIKEYIDSKVVENILMNKDNISIKVIA